MPVQITSLLEGFFLAGEADRTRRYTAETNVGRVERYGGRRRPVW